MVIYLDTAALTDIRDFAKEVSGVTTNPSLMRKSGISDYRQFANLILELVPIAPVSFEVFADDLDGMEKQAREIASWGNNIYVKLPVTNTKGESVSPLMRKLGMDDIKINATAIMTLSQIETVARSLIYAPAILSIFCGRIADTGVDPVPFITKALAVKHHTTQILWASTREVLNVKQAQAAGADIITMSPDLIRKMELFGYSLEQYSLDTVKQFHADSSGLTL